MFELVQAGGWMMLPIIACSIAAGAIVAERLWFLTVPRVAPQTLLPQVWGWLRDESLTVDRVRELRETAPLGQVLAAALGNARRGRDAMRGAIDDALEQVEHDLERFLNELGTIAAITPYLGILGTVIGMIRVFTAISLEGTGDAQALSGGISEAFITTAAGLLVAIPARAMHRYLLRRVDALVLQMQAEGHRLVEILDDGSTGEDA